MQQETWQFDGMVNVLFLLGIVGAVFLPEAWFPLREVVMTALAYLNFLQLAQTTAMVQSPPAFAMAHGDPVAIVRILLDQQPRYVIAFSLGSVFFGGMTYIGNGPNFMVKSIAHDAGVHCPTFVTYISKYSLPILLPVLIASAWLFLRS